MTILELPDEKKLVSSGYECVIHMHAIAAQVEISKIEARIDKATGKKVAAGFLKPGEKGLCQIKVRRSVARLNNRFASRSTSSCRVWAGSLSATRASNSASI